MAPTTHPLSSFAAKKQADQLIAGLRGARARQVTTPPASSRRPTGESIPLVAAIPELELAPTTRKIGLGNRLNVIIDGTPLGELMLLTSIGGEWRRTATIQSIELAEDTKENDDAR